MQAGGSSSGREQAPPRQQQATAAAMTCEASSVAVCRFLVVDLFSVYFSWMTTMAGLRPGGAL
eukprot:COSAG01_NODE_1987_length_8707_cov_2.906366_1_plen_63_part_00